MCCRDECGYCSAKADLVITRGEVVEFSTWTPHWFGAIDEAVEMILILGPEGAHEHLHRD